WRETYCYFALFAGGDCRAASACAGEISAGDYGREGYRCCAAVGDHYAFGFAARAGAEYYVAEAQAVRRHAERTGRRWRRSRRLSWGGSRGRSGGCGRSGGLGWGGDLGWGAWTW